MILVTGASGQTGGSVVDALLKKGKTFKAMYRSQNDAAALRPGVEAVFADFADRDSLARAFDGIETLFLVCAPIPQLVDFEKTAIDVAKQTGVRHIVLNSALGAEDYPISFPSWHRQVEQHLKAAAETGRPGYTIVRPNAFMQNIISYDSASIRAQSAFYNGLGTARTSYIDVRDVADVVASVLISPAAHQGHAYELNGPEPLTEAEVAERISRAAGRPVTYVAISQADQQAAMEKMGLEPWRIEAILGLQRYYLEGKGGEVTGVLEQILGRKPNTIEQFVIEFRDKFIA